MSIKLLKRLSCGIFSTACCCLFCLLLATAANADVCFLPTGQCENARSLSSGCSGYNLAESKDETGWNCEKCGNKWKCNKKSCKDDYQTGVVCSSTETKVCDETRKAGDESCCKCEDAETKCQHDGYVFKKTKTNENCKNKCPYKDDMYESCECNAKYDKAKDSDKCYAYNECELGDMAGTKKYQQANSLKKCENYEGKDQYAKTGDKILNNDDYTCVPKCAEDCSGITYYECSVKSNCKASEGKYDTEAACRASLQQASVFDLFKKYIPNFNYSPSLNIVSTGYAATLDHEICWYCKTDPNPSECYKACIPQTALDPKPLCPLDQDRNCVSCANDCDRQGHKCCSNFPGTTPSQGCIGMAMEKDMNCVHCLTSNPTWRAEGCEGYPCCVEEPTILCRVNLQKNCAKCTGDCDRGSYPCCLDEPKITDCPVDFDRDCALCDGECTNKIDCCDAVENSPCEKDADGCWVAKKNDACKNGPYSWRDTECCSLDKYKNLPICKKPTCTITAGGKSFTTPLHPYDVSSFYPTAAQCKDERFTSGLGLYNRSGTLECAANDPIVAMVRYCGSMNDFSNIDDMNVLANEMYRTSNGAAITNNSYHAWLDKSAPNYSNLSIKNMSLVNTLKTAAGHGDYFWINTQDNYSSHDTGGVYLYYNSNGIYKYYALGDGTVNTNSYNLGMCVCRDAVDCTGCEYCIPSTCTDSGQKRIISDSSTYEACGSSCGGKYKCKSGFTPQYVGSNQYKCVSNTGPITCTIDPDDPDVFLPAAGYWQLDEISCDDGIARSVPGDVALKYSSDAGCNTTVTMTVRKNSTDAIPILGSDKGSCSGRGCVINHGGNSWCREVSSTCVNFDSSYSKDSTGHYVTEDGQKIYWQVDGSENYTGECSAGGGCESQYKSQCDSWGGTLKSSTSYVTEDVCHAVYGECDNKYWYCLKPGCSEGGGTTVDSYVETTDMNEVDMLYRCAIAQYLGTTSTSNWRVYYTKEANKSVFGATVYDKYTKKAIGTVEDCNTSTRANEIVGVLLNGLCVRSRDICDLTCLNCDKNSGSYTKPGADCNDNRYWTGCGKHTLPF